MPDLGTSSAAASCQVYSAESSKPRRKVANIYLSFSLEVGGNNPLRCVGSATSMPSEAWRSENKFFTKTTKNAAKRAKAQAHTPPQSGKKTPCLTETLSHRDTVPATGSRRQRGILRHPQGKACWLPSAPDAAGGNRSTEGSQTSGPHPLQTGVRVV